MDKDENYNNRSQKTLYLMICQLRNKFIETPSKSLVEDKLIHIRRLAKANDEEEYLNKLIKENFR